MALSIDVTLDSGLSAPSSYVQVTSVSLLSKSSASTSISFFASDAKIAPYQVKHFMFVYNLDGSNPIAQAYLHLKTLPEYQDAVDC